MTSTASGTNKTKRTLFLSAWEQRMIIGNYEAVIIGQSQFEKIPLSPERQIAMIERQIEPSE